MKPMRIASATIIGVILCSFQVKAQDDVKKQDEYRKCDALAAEIMAAIGAEYVRTSEIMHNIFMRHSDADDIVFECGADGFGQSVSVSWDKGAFPPNVFFALTAKAGSVVTGESAGRILSALHQCHQAALKSDGEMDEIDLPKIEIDCQAFTRDGGAVSFDVSRKK